MAERRMFAKTIVLSDAFLDLPLSARCLYFTLGMLADDDGFVNNPKSIMRQTGASVDDLNLLVAKRFLLCFDSGVIVIKHWRINNYLRNDRYVETKYIEERRSLSTDENGAYRFGIPGGIPSNGIPRIVKDSIVKDSIVKESVNDGSEALPAKPPAPAQFVPPSVDEVRAYCTERGNGVDAERFVDYYTARGWLAGKSKMKDWKAAVRTWERNDREDRHGSTDTGEAAADVPERGQYGTWL